MDPEILNHNVVKLLNIHALVRSRFEDGLSNAYTNGNKAKVALILVCQANFDKISSHLDWTTPRTEGDIESFPGNFPAAIQYALLETGNDVSQNYDTKDANDWSRIVNGILQSNEQRLIFVENFWRSPMVARPRRGAALQCILPQFFGDKEISGVDLGAGLHVALPSLNSESYRESVNKLGLVYQPVRIAQGIGVDKQPIELGWAIASEGPSPNAKSNVSELQHAYTNAIGNQNQFPFVSASVFSPENYLTSQVDFAFSSFVRHQLGTDRSMQNRFRTAIGQAVKEGGIWVDIGKEFFEPSQKLYQGYDVDVYQIISGTPRHIGTPFVLSGNQIDIQEVNKAFWQK
jgi:hypothetical protein